MTPGPTKYEQIDTARGALPLASWWSRVWGYLLDAVILGVATFTIEISTGVIHFRQVLVETDGTTRETEKLFRGGSTAEQVVVHFVVLAITLLYPYLLLRYKGQTVGMMATGITAVDAASGAALTSGQTVRRVLALFALVTLWTEIGFWVNLAGNSGATSYGSLGFGAVGALLFMVSAFWALGNARNQTLQDKAASTIVIRTRR